MPFGLVKVEQGQALIKTKIGAKEPQVSFTGTFVPPFLYKIELMDISVKTIEIDRRGSDGLICRDNIRADIRVTFFVRVNKTKEDVIKVAQAIGCTRASDRGTLEELFSAKFSEALKTAGKALDFVDLYTQREEFRDGIINVIGTDLNGYSLEDCAIDYLEQTPLTELDESNILDAQGIRKITELTAIEHVKTNDLQNNERKRIKKQDVEAAEAIFELERQKADAQAKQQREIETVKAREQAETLKVQEEERLKAETARIKSDEDLAIQEENKQRQVQVAQKNRERVVAVESERVEKDRALEIISRERETELQRIAKDKEVENEKREIAIVIRERIAVEKTVAEEEEAIKRLRVVEEANRTREALVIGAEGQAQELLVKDIKAAEAAEKAAVHLAAEKVLIAEADAQEKLIEQVKAAEAAEEAAKFKARERITLAEAELETTDREAKAKVRRAEADFEAAEKDAEGKKRLAEGIRAESAAAGLAEVQVKAADADAIQKLGLAEAKVLREKGLAEADAIGSKLQAEALGIGEKAKAMALLDESSRQHEEYRLRLEMERAVELASVEARQQIAISQASVLSEGLKSANIDIVGGESIFFDRLVDAMSAGKAIDGFVNKSDSAQKLLGDYLEGRSSLPGDIKEALSGLSSGDLQNLSVATLLGKLATSSGSEKAALGELAKQIGGKPESPA
jgi:uncharacterized membrane protein YqiK